MSFVSASLLNSMLSSILTIRIRDVAYGILESTNRTRMLTGGMKAASDTDDGVSGGARPLDNRVNPSPVNVEGQKLAVLPAHHDIQRFQGLADLRWSKRPFRSHLIDASGDR